VCFVAYQGKAEEITTELIRSGEVAKTEEAKFVKNLMEQAEKSRVKVEKKIEIFVGSAYPASAGLSHRMG